MHRSNDDQGEGSKAVGADFLQLDTAEAGAGGLAEWLAGRLRHAIRTGRLPTGSRLPATRTLAAELGVSRGVVTEAYQRLSEEGHVAGRGRGGTVVGMPGAVRSGAPVPGAPDSTGPRPGAGPLPPYPSGLFSTTPTTDVYDALRAAPARIDLTPGVPDLAAFPRAEWLRAERTVLATLSASDLAYGDPRGTPALRRAVAGWLARYRGITADPGEIVIVSGTAQAITLLAEVLRDHGVREVAMEDPGSLGARQHLANRRLATPPVPVDADGLRVDLLRATGAPAVLLTPAHQFPTGVVLSGERRRELVEWARASDGLVIEDDYDAEHRYDRPPVAALHSLLPEHVAYAGSVSKLLAPALRVGWLIAPPRYRAALVDAKRYADLGNPALPQLVLAHLMESGALERQLRLLRKRHRARRDTMIAAIAAHLPDAVVHGAAAGLHLMITFPTDCHASDCHGTGRHSSDCHNTGRHTADRRRLGPALDDTALAAAALARGVKTQPLSWHHQGPTHPPGLILGYAAGARSEIAEGVALLGEVVRELRT